MTNEAHAANLLREILRDTIPPSAKGTIWILSGVNVPFGKVADIDILLIADLEDCIVELNGQEINIRSFCSVIELKEHDISKISLNNNDIYVSYNNGDHLKNASQQNRDQKFSLLNYTYHLNLKIFISNFVWLGSVSSDDFLQNPALDSISALPSDFSFEELIKKVIVSGMRVYSNQLCVSDPGKYDYHASITDLVRHLAQPRPIAPPKLRRKIESLVDSFLEDKSHQIIARKDFCVVEGNAGTGKTFLLMKTALKLASIGKNCVIVTYNNALVLDLQRLLFFMDFGNDVRSRIKISTVQSHILSVAKNLGWTTSDYNFSKLKEYVSLKEQQFGGSPLIHTMKLDIDYIFIDEAQDCSTDEKEILKAIYGYDRIVVSLSQYQLIRDNKRAKWGATTIPLVYGLRQKSNLVKFLNSLAYEMGLTNTCVSANPITGLSGGKVILACNYYSDIHTRLEKEAKEAGCSNYDILVLVPPVMVNATGFKKADLWRNVAQIDFIDGTRDTQALIRCKPNELIDSCRVFQYESCRGLEGWSTVCYGIDALVDCKLRTWKKDSSDCTVLGDLEEIKRQDVYRWLFMPLTRAIDTIVITVDDPESPIAQLLKAVALRFPDFVECKLLDNKC